MKKTVCIQGLGFVGSAMATAVAMAKNTNGSPMYDVIGVDLPNEMGMTRVDQINRGIFPFETSDEKLLEVFSEVHKAGNLMATVDESVYAKADIIVVDIQLDIPYLDDEPQLEFEGLKKAIGAIGKKVAKDTLIIVETTVPPGTCEKIIVPTLKSELNKRKMNADSVLVAHSYERVMPGKDYLDSIINYWRVFAGYTESAGDACEEFLATVVNVDNFPLTRLSNTTASETAKVMENTYRAVNIAFVDEWSKYAEKVGIDLYEVVDAIRMRPTHSNIRFPGLGVGGYCLTKDPTFTPAAGKQIFNIDNLDFPFSKMAVSVNHDMPLHSVLRLKELLGGSLKDKKILVCGVSYREDVGDTRYSPTETLVKSIQDGGAEVAAHDPFVSFWEELNQNVYREIPKLKGFDAVVFCVSHSVYKQQNIVSLLLEEKLAVLDTNNVLTGAQRESLRNGGILLESIGRGTRL
jgi:UDP-N-acetyl-D-glucosamine dehydrogenase